VLPPIQPDASSRWPRPPAPVRLRELGVPEADLPGLAVATAERGGNLANPKPASPAEIEGLLREVY
jgi:Alcohol dehydrogenase, class IV